MAPVTGSIAEKTKKHSSYYSRAGIKRRKNETSKRQESTGATTKRENDENALTVSYDAYLSAELANPAFAAGYLNECMNDDDPKVFLVALRHVIRANGGFAKLSEETGLNRESLYKAFSKKGNPSLSYLKAAFGALPINLELKPKA